MTDTQNLTKKDTSLEDYDEKLATQHREICAYFEDKISALAEATAEGIKELSHLNADAMDAMSKAHEAKIAHSMEVWDALNARVLAYETEISGLYASMDAQDALILKLQDMAVAHERGIAALERDALDDGRAREKLAKDLLPLD